jgi:hypothetical protein
MEGPSRSHCGHLPPAPAATAFAGPPPHPSVHVAPVAQASEHEPVHVMLHVEPATQLTLALSPTLTVQFAFGAHSTLHDLPQVPEQVDESAQRIEQLSTFWQLPKLHRALAAQLHDVPTQVAGGSAVLLLEHAAIVVRIETTTKESLVRPIENSSTSEVRDGKPPRMLPAKK